MSSESENLSDQEAQIRVDAEAAREAILEGYRDLAEGRVMKFDGDLLGMIERFRAKKAAENGMLDILPAIRMINRN